MVRPLLRAIRRCGVDIRLGGSVGVHVAADVMRTSRGTQALDYDRTWRLQAGLVVPMR
jgi:hypothetical protein